VSTIDLILSGLVDPEEAEVEKSAARVQAGTERALLRLPPPGERPGGPGKSAATPKDQARLVREAVAKHPGALVVEPADPADRELAQAIREARAAKLPVILLGRAMTAEAEVPAGSPAAPVILVAPSPFGDSARQLVASAIRNAKNANLKLEGGAILLINTACDLLAGARVAAIRDALKAAGITTVEEIRFARETQAASKALIARFKSGSQAVLVFSVDNQGAMASNEAAVSLGSERPFIQAAYTSEENLLRMVPVGEFAALATYIPTKLVRRAVTTAIAAAQGRDVRGPVELPIEVKDSPPKTGAPRLQSQSKTLKKAKTED
jgi:hypothetical protein